MKGKEKGLFFPQWLIDEKGISLEAAIIALLLSYRNTKNGTLFMKQTEMAKKLHVTDRGIRKAIESLCGDEIIIKSKCKATRGNEYCLNEEHPMLFKHITSINNPQSNSIMQSQDEPF